MRSKQFCRCVPQLSGFVRLLLVECVLKFNIALVYQSVELGFVVDGVEVERSMRVEDGRVLREVAVERVVEAV